MIMIMAHFSRSSMQRLLYYSTPSFHLRHLSTELPRNIWVTSGSIDPTEKLMPCMIRHTDKSSSTATFHRLSPERLRNVWISGLLDPSKLLLTERRLLYTGEIDKMEDARCEIEKKDNNTESYIKQESWLKLGLGKGVISRTVLNWVFNPKSDSIPADLTFFDWRDNYKMTVIDTPDHVDFTPEVQNALRAFDGAVFVLDSVDGVQSHSIVVNKQMVTYQLPRLVFINNLDQKGANPWEVVNQARLKLQHHIAAVQVPIGLEYNFKGLVDLVQLKSYYFHGPNGIMVVIEEVPADMEALVLEKRHELIKTVSDVDDKLAEAFCSGKPISAADLQEAIRRATIARKFIPFFMGSAFKYKGLQLILDGVLNYLPCPTEAINSAPIQSKNEEKQTLLALAFTLKRKYDLITYIRIYGGMMRKGEFITNINTGKTFKVPHFSEAVRKYKIGVPHSIEAQEDERKVPYLIEPQKDDLGVPYLVCERTGEAFQEAHAGEIIAVHDVFNAPGDTFTDGLVRYTKASIDVS